ncbi:uracil-DNA glycosylase-like isoform X2 [Lineus longissimus]|uniref:uracil-DNA glycosylase-like isoform X2 n=1 Tax=Lineus longissimus TaxID=88925 RepID=UPI00315D8B35
MVKMKNVETGDEITPKKQRLNDFNIANRLNKTPIQSPKASGSSDEDQENAPLSPDQRLKIEQNRLSAKMIKASRASHGLLTNIGPSWFKALEPEFSKPYFLRLGKMLAEERQKNTVYPPKEQVFSWTQMCDVNLIQVVILGQDPYHGPNQAHGLAFSVRKGVPPPPSLVNMYKELENDIPGFKKPSHGDLTGWARQGVLMLNACLTVRDHQANSHKDQGWEKFTDAVIKYFNSHHSGIVFVLWGGYAQKKGSFINTKKHHVIKGPHPSPLSAHRGFFGCKHFSKVNDCLEKEKKTPIDWTLLP